MTVFLYDLMMISESGLLFGPPCIPNYINIEVNV